MRINHTTFDGNDVKVLQIRFAPEPRHVADTPLMSGTSPVSHPVAGLAWPYAVAEMNVITESRSVENERASRPGDNADSRVQRLL